MYVYYIYIYMYVCSPSASPAPSASTFRRPKFLPTLSASVPSIGIAYPGHLHVMVNRLRTDQRLKSNVLLALSHRVDVDDARRDVS